MIKKLKVTVDGKPYEVTVEMEEKAAPPAAPPPATASAASVPVAPASPAPASTTSAPPASQVGAIVSPLSGRVVALNVGLDQVVKDGEHVLTLEAMKMNTFVFTQNGGKVKEVKVAVGDTVSENQVLILIE